MEFHSVFQMGSNARELVEDKIVDSYKCTWRAAGSLGIASLSPVTTWECINQLGRTCPGGCMIWWNATTEPKLPKMSPFLGIALVCCNLHTTDAIGTAGTATKGLC